MDQYTETYKTWNKIASLYEDKFMNLPIYNHTYDFFCNSILKDKAKIVEIGCGPGNVTKYLLSKRPNFTVSGIDNSENMIELARKNNPGATFEIMDCRKINALKTKYEGIISGFCLPYLSQSDCIKLIADTYNLLVETGVFYVSFVEGDLNKSGFQVASSGDRSYFYYHHLENLKEQLICKGFEDIEILKVPYAISERPPETHTIVIGRKKVVDTNNFK